MKSKLSLPANIAMEQQRQNELLAQVMRARNELAFAIFTKNLDLESDAFTPKDVAERSINAAMIFMEVSGMVSFVEGQSIEAP